MSFSILILSYRGLVLILIDISNQFLYMEFRKLISWYLIVCILLQNILFLFPNMVSAAPDADGSANIDLYLTPTIPSSSIIGKNFTLDIALESKNTSDGDGYRPGIVLNLPA